jgi:hypothetical protein
VIGSRVHASPKTIATNVPVTNVASDARRIPRA